MTWPWVPCAEFLRPRNPTMTERPNLSERNDCMSEHENQRNLEIETLSDDDLESASGGAVDTELASENTGSGTCSGSGSTNSGTGTCSGSGSTNSGSGTCSG